MQRLLVLLVPLWLGACAAGDPGLRLADPPHVAAPDGVDRADVTFVGRGGIALYGERWRPTATPRGVVVIHHGLADHADRYSRFAERLVAAGYAVWALDMRGHGRSSGARVAIDEIDDLLGDLDAFLAVVRAAEPGPIFLYGHSVGGLTTALYAIERQPAVAGVVLAAPGIAVDGPAIQAAVIRTVAAIAPSAPIFVVPHDLFSRDPVVVAEMNRDPLIDQHNAPARTARAAVDGIARVWAHPERLAVPLLVVHGEADRVTAASGSRELVARAGNADRTLRLYPGVYHDVLNTPGGDQVAVDVVAWLDAHTGGPAVAAVPLPTGRLPGDRRPSALAIELDVRGEHGDHDEGATAGLRLRVATGRTLGYAGGLDLRAGNSTAGARSQPAALSHGRAVTMTVGATPSTATCSGSRCAAAAA